VTGAETAAEALARLYDLDLADDPGDRDLYLALAARTGGPVLELMSGTGRITVPLAAAGHEVTGVDLDPAMLARAQAAVVAAGPEVAARIHLVEGDARSIRLPDADRFELAFVPLNSIFLAASRPEQAAVVNTLAAHLAPGGLAVVDVWLPNVEDLGRFDGRLVLEWVREDSETGDIVTKTGSALYEPATGVVRLTTVFEAGPPGEPPARWVRVDRLRQIGPEELAALATAAGLEVETLAGDYGLEPLTVGAERAILIARRT
jgi:SAM-dependent methyltransferase